MDINYTYTEETIDPLSEIAFKYGTDKCPQIDHPYTVFYYQLLKERQYSTKKVLEIGIGSRHMRVIPNYVVGASLRMWRDFFPNATIYGADILKESLFTDERLETFYCDSTNDQDIKNLISQTGSDIDLVIDDGSHHYEDQVFLLKNLMPLLKHDATYIVEDCLRPNRLSKNFLEYNSFVPILPPGKKRGKGNHLVVFTNK